MAVPTDKEALQRAIIQQYGKLQKELRSVPPDQTTAEELEGHAKGTAMSLNNLIAYLIGWGQLVLKWNQKKDNNEPVTFPETGFKWNELGKLAQKFYQDYSADDYTILLGKLDETVNEILHLIESKTNQELYEVAWYDKWTRGRMIQFNTSSPYSNATARIRKWKKQKGQ